MTLEDVWLAHFKAIVDREAVDGGSLRAGYRAVAAKLDKSVEYIYQIYQGKPKANGAPRVISLELSKAIGRHYADGRTEDWINIPPPTGVTDNIEADRKIATIATERWPFHNVTYKRFMALPIEARREIDEYLEGMVSTQENKIRIKAIKSKLKF